VVIKVLYNLFLHPLRSFPGPLSGRAAQISYQRHLLRGSSHLQLQELHRKYGPVVRYAPNELSFIEPQAWKDIYGHKASAFVKDIKIFYGPEEYGDAPGLIRANDADHARQRRLVSHAFSDKAMKEQEQLLKGHIGILIERLRDIAAGKNDGKTDMVEWYNFTTFDIMSDLTFGESLGQLSSSTYNPWVESVFGFVKLVSVTRVCREYPGVTPLLEKLLPADLMAKKDAHINFSTERVNERMARKTDRPDIWTFVNRYSEIEGQSLAPSELHSNGGLFMLAGTETTATQLSGLTYLLLKNPEKLARLTNEVRSAFTSLVDLTMTKLAQLPYLQACIDEGLRLYPPVPFGLARIAPKEGANVCSRWVPGSVRPIQHDASQYSRTLTSLTRQSSSVRPGSRLTRP
jgi:cytochrome P450